MFRFRNRRRIGDPSLADKLVPITRLSDGQNGKVIQVLGGKGITDRLAALGIRQGQKITRIGGMYLHGPVTIQVEKTQVAIGFGMATKIFVELEK